MKAIKQLAILVLAFTILQIGGSCQHVRHTVERAARQHPLVGTWESEKINPDKYEASLIYESYRDKLTFNADNTYARWRKYSLKSLLFVIRVDSVLGYSIYDEGWWSVNDENMLTLTKNKEATQTKMDYVINKDYDPKIKESIDSLLSIVNRLPIFKEFTDLMTEQVTITEQYDDKLILQFLKDDSRLITYIRCDDSNAVTKEAFDNAHEKDSN